MGRSNGDRAGQNRRLWLDKWWRLFQAFLRGQARLSDSPEPATPAGRSQAELNYASSSENRQLERRFTIDDVIAFLQQQRDSGKAAWQRVQIVDSLAEHRELLVDETKLSLASIREKLALIDLQEQERLSADQVDQSRIDTSNSEVVQAMQIILRRLHYSKRTEEAYIDWIKRFESQFQLGTFQSMETVDEAEVKEFLNDLAVTRNVASSTQNQAFSALLFLFKHILNRPLKDVDAIRAKKPKQLSVVLSRKEISAVMDQLAGSLSPAAATLFLALAHAITLSIAYATYSKCHRR